MDDIEQNKFNIMRNLYLGMTLELEDIKLESEGRKATIDRLSAEIGKFKRKEKRNKNS